jgi:hypothetical protein
VRERHTHTNTEEGLYLIHDVHFSEDTYGPESLRIHATSHLQAVAVDWDVEGRTRRGRGGGSSRTDDRGDR